MSKKTWVTIVVWVFLLLAFAFRAESRNKAPFTQSAALPLTESAPVQDIMPLQVTGSPANRVDLLIMGDGFTEAERDKFFTYADYLAQQFFNITPYSQYRNFVNVYALFTPSQESGATHPPYKIDCPPDDDTCCGDESTQYDPLAGTFVQTAFHASFCKGGILRQLKADQNLILSAASAVPDWDRIMVIVNDEAEGGFGEAGVEIVLVSTHPAMVSLAQHEYGHGFTGLGDEYVDSTIHSNGCKEADGSCPPNITDEVVREKIKWAPWIKTETPIPTPETSDFEHDVVGLFEGALYLSQGLYRAQYHCMMRDFSAFCSICAQEYVLKLYKGGWGVPEEGIDLIEPGSETPPPGNVFSSSSQSTTFSVDLLQPVGNQPLEVTWLVNDIPVLGANTNSFTYTPSGPEDVKVEIRVKDVTPLVNPAMAGTYLYSGRVWHVITGIPQLSVTPTVYDYGNVKVKRGKTTSFVVKNAGTANLLILASTITGADSSSFTIISGRRSKTVKPGKRLTIMVAFKPKSQGSKSANLKITSNDPVSPAVDIPLSGTGH